MNESAANNAFGPLIEPEPIGYSFNTPGWYLVLGVLFLLALVWAIVQYRKYKRNAYRIEAIAQIEKLAQENKPALAFEINRRLKIVAIEIFGREKVASLFGQDWFSFLNESMKTSLEGNFNDFSEAIYNTEYSLGEKEKTKLLDFATTWIKKHDVKNV